MRSKWILSAFVIAAWAAFALSAFGQQTQKSDTQATHRFAVPPGGRIKVAFVLTDGAVMIDFAGPWEVFQDVHDFSRGSSMADQMLFDLYVVSDSKDPIQASDGMKIVPDYTFDDAPKPQIVVVPAQGGDSPKMMQWVRRMSTESDVLMSVCNGAFKLAEAGVLNGKKATSHHSAYARFQSQFPKVILQRGMRWVQADPVIYTAGGLSSGIDLALHIVDLYFGRSIAEETARQMEYESKAWMGDGKAAVNFAAPKSNPSDGLTGGAFGNWEGVLKSSDGTFPVAIHIWKDKTGQLTGTVDSLDEGASGIAITGAHYTNSDLHFEVPSIDGVFDGKINSNGSEVSGTWKQRGGSYPLILKRRSS